MTEIQKAPKIFISYSWTTPLHEDWVISLAERLMSDGVEVIINVTANAKKDYIL